MTCIICIIGAIVIIRIGWGVVFKCNGYQMKEVVYKSSNLNIQRLKPGTSNNLVILGNGWNVSLDDNNKIVRHDPVFCMPNAEVKQILECSGDNEVLFTYFPFECSGIEVASIELANFLNSHYQTKQITFIGHSKSALQFIESLNYLKKDSKNVKLIIASPTFGGVLPDEQVMSKLGWFSKLMYRLIFAPHRVNEDVTIGSKFLTQVANFSILNNYNKKYLFRSQINKHRFTLNPIELFLRHIDNQLGINGDGITGFDNQYYHTNWASEDILYVPHNASLPLAILWAREVRGAL